MSNTKSVLDKQVSFFDGYFTSQPVREENLLTWLTTDRYRKAIEDLRKYSKGKRKKMQSKLDAVTPSGLFAPTKEAKNLTTHSGLICIDIDQQDNLHLPIAKFKERISRIQEVAYCGLSASGKGLFVILPIKKPALHVEYFWALERYFKEKLYITVDTACKDVCRLRTCSYDPSPYINHSATVFATLPKPENTASIKNFNGPADNTIVSNILNAATSQKTDITAIQEDWYQICCVLVNTYGEDGREMFHIFSQHHPRYSRKECDKKYDYYLEHRYNYNIGTLIEIAKKYNI